MYVPSVQQKPQRCMLCCRLVLPKSNFIRHLIRNKSLFLLQLHEVMTVPSGLHFMDRTIRIQSSD